MSSRIVITHTGFNRRLRGSALPFRFVKIAQAQFGNADTAGFEWFPNEL
jgi:hypothetical protein